MPKVLFFFLFSCTLKAEVVFLAKVQFAERIFNDILILKQSPSEASQKSSGTFTVPGQFTTPIDSMISHSSIQVKGEGTEGGRKFPFSIVAKKSPDSLVYKGAIFVGEDNPLTGSINLQKIYED